MRGGGVCLFVVEDALHERVGGLSELLIDVAGRIDRLTSSVAQLSDQVDGTRARLDELAREQAEVNSPVLRVKRALKRVVGARNR